MNSKAFALVLLASLFLVGPAAQAQSWPAKPVRIIVAVPPGGTTDLVGRLLAKKYTDSLGQTFLVDNRPGASSMIGTELVIRSPADGYTLFFSSASLSVNATLFGAKYKFDPSRDLAPIIWTSSVPLVLTVHPSIPAKNVKELAAISKRARKGLNGGHNGSGTTSHIALEMFRQMTGATLEAIGYKGGGPTTIAMLSGEIDFTFSTLSTVKSHVESGRLRALAVTTKKPSRVFPELPTMDAMYPGFESDNWFGLFAPAGISKDIVGRLHGLAVEGLRSPELRDVITKDGSDIVASSPEALGVHLRNEIARYAKVIKAGNITAE
jgi:tripartite-type tricarboxylate transporter receptor subunit TctC